MSPPLNWSGIPGGAKSLALIVDDPDAPDPAAPKTIWTHWVLYNLPASDGTLPEGAMAGDLLKTREGPTTGNEPAIAGPARRSAGIALLPALRPRPRFTRPRPADPYQTARQHGSHVVVSCELMGTYQRGSDLVAIIGNWQLPHTTYQLSITNYHPCHPRSCQISLRPTDYPRCLPFPDYRGQPCAISSRVHQHIFPRVHCLPHRDR